MGKRWSKGRGRRVLSHAKGPKLGKKIAKSKKIRKN
jgi:hypothetical protein